VFAGVPDSSQHSRSGRSSARTIPTRSCSRTSGHTARAETPPPRLTAVRGRLFGRPVETSDPFWRVAGGDGVGTRRLQFDVILSHTAAGSARDQDETVAVDADQIRCAMEGLTQNAPADTNSSGQSRLAAQTQMLRTQRKLGGAVLKRCFPRKRPTPCDALTDLTVQ